MSVQIATLQTELTLEEKLGSFVFSCLQQAGVVEIYQRLREETVLSLTEVEYLANEVSLPVLGKLVEILNESFGMKQPVTIRPVVFLPLAEWLETGGKSAAFAKGKDHLTLVLSELELENPLSVAVDRWSGAFHTEELLQVLVSLCEAALFDHPLIPMGPSTSEIKAVVEKGVGRKGDEVEGVRRFLSILQLHQINMIEGGADFHIHEIAARLGFSLSIGTSISKQEGKGKKSCFGGEFFKDLLFLQKQLLPTGQVKAWFPWSEHVLDTKLPLANDPLGEQLLRAVTLGRLLFSRVPYIRAPLSLLGIKVAHVATFFGANDLGFAAVDALTATRLGIARWSEVTEFIKRHQERIS